MNEINRESLPKHIAIIMDGNRRWAKEKGLDKKLGHKQGAETLEKIANYANDLGIKYLTVYAFSTENWKRTTEEVGALMLLLKSYVDKFLKRANTNNIKIQLLGNLEQLDSSLKNGIEKVMADSSKNTGLTLNIAFNYGGRSEITKATQEIVQKVLEGKISVEDINEQVVSEHLYTSEEPDLVIRTGGELRLSGFLLWQVAYSELLFLDKYWPDFSEDDLIEAIKEFQNRKRNLGK